MPRDSTRISTTPLLSSDGVASNAQSPLYSPVTATPPLKAENDSHNAVEHLPTTGTNNTIERYRNQEKDELCKRRSNNSNNISNNASMAVDADTPVKEVNMGTDGEEQEEESPNHIVSTMEFDRDPENRWRMKPWLHKWLNYLKTYFLFAHVLYILLVTVISAVLMYSVERQRDNIFFFDVYFVAVSAVANTGLSTINVENFTVFSDTIRHMTMIAGGCVITSGITPMLRLLTLRRLKVETTMDPNDRASLRRWKKRKRNFIKRLETTALICIFVTYGHWLLWHFLGFALIMMYRGDMTTGTVVGYVVAAFQNSLFNSVTEYANNPMVVFMMPLLTAAGGTLYAVFFRGNLIVVRTIFRLWRYTTSK